MAQLTGLCPMLTDNVECCTKREEVQPIDTAPEQKLEDGIKVTTDKNSPHVLTTQAQNQPLNMTTPIQQRMKTTQAPDAIHGKSAEEISNGRPVGNYILDQTSGMEDKTKITRPIEIVQSCA